MISLVLGILGIILMLLRLYIYYHNGHRGVICFLDFLIILAEYAAYFTGGNFSIRYVHWFGVLNLVLIVIYHFLLKNINNILFFLKFLL